MSALGRLFIRMKKKEYEGKERKEKEKKKRRKLDIYTAAFNSWIALHGNPPQ